MDGMDDYRDIITQIVRPQGDGHQGTDKISKDLNGRFKIFKIPPFGSEWRYMVSESWEE